MKILKANSEKTIVTLSKKEWKEIGINAGWIKKAQSGLQPGIHPTHVTQEVESLQGGTIKLTAAVYNDLGDTQVDIWGNIDGGNPIYPPRDPDKSVAKHGGVDGYKNSPARGLFHHITLAQYLSFQERAKKHFLLKKNKNN